MSRILETVSVRTHLVLGRAAWLDWRPEGRGTRLHVSGIVMPTYGIVQRPSEGDNTCAGRRAASTAQ